MSRSEHAEQNDALMGLTKLSDSLFYRQNTGQAWQGRPVKASPGEYVRVQPGMKILADARPVRFGLEGAGDIVGQRKGKAVQVEMKTLTGPQREAQEVFERQWVKRGGIYVLARSAKEAISEVRRLTD